ncbi:MAG: phosphopyruvate hydratase [Planctomycetota bacterium]|jgi:enolase
MGIIIDLDCRMILDSRGFPTVEVDCLLDDGAFGRAAVPSGASTGAAEALELRDGGSAWGGKGVEKALEHIRGEISDAVVGHDAIDQAAIDRLLVELDGTDNKARLGANATLGVSMAVARAAAESSELPLYRYLGGAGTLRLPIPLLNVVNGGAHANNSLDFQEFMLAPCGAPDFPTALRMGVEVYHALKRRLADRGLTVAVGDEGGFAPDLPGDEAVLEELAAAVDDAGYGSGCGKEFAFALDVAASEFHREGAYHLSTEPEPLSAEQMTARYAELAKMFPITSIEDGLAEDDWAGWQHLTRSLDGVRLIGDDLLVTQTSRLRRAIDEGAADAILIKLNQVGTVSETLEACRLAADHGFRVVISHRSGETEDDFIADLAVATGCGWIKTGAPCRSERNAKYNRLLRIADQLGGDAGFGPLRW